MITETLLECGRWENVGIDRLAEAACRATLSHLGLAPDQFEIVVLAADDERVAALNGQFRGKSWPTNVLSWPSEERGADQAGDHPQPPSGPELGDIALSWETCAAEARKFGRGFEDHVTHLIVHGTLHLLGYDHGTEADAALMERLEVEILASIGVPDPYS